MTDEDIIAETEWLLSEQEKSGPLHQLEARNANFVLTAPRLLRGLVEHCFRYNKLLDERSERLTQTQGELECERAVTKANQAAIEALQLDRRLMSKVIKAVRAMNPLPWHHHAKLVPDERLAPLMEALAEYDAVVKEKP